MPITPITPLFERVKDLYNTHHPKILGKNEKVDFNKKGRVRHLPITPLFWRANDTYNTNHSKNHEKASEKQPLTPIIQKIVVCYSHPCIVCL